LRSMDCTRRPEHTLQLIVRYHHGMPSNVDNRASVRVRLRPVKADDVPTLFEHQLDPESNWMAAVKPREREAFGTHWAKILEDRSSVARAILADDELVGQISCFRMDGVDMVGYWIAKAHWGRGIATQALALLLKEVATRPLIARVARHNVASIRVLERCGFIITGYESSPESERYTACEEAIMRLG